jgi:hypothetical protein
MRGTGILVLWELYQRERVNPAAPLQLTTMRAVGSRRHCFFDAGMPEATVTHTQVGLGVGQ